MNVLVMGAGALGSILGGFLARAGHTVTLVGRAAHMAAIREAGLRVTGIWGDHTIAGITACTSVEEVWDRNFDVVFIAVKSYDTATAIAAVAPLLADHTLVVSYQNGLGNAETIAEAVGAARVVEAMVIFGVHIPDPGHVDVTVIARPTALGVYPGGPDPAWVRALAEALDEAALPTVYSDQIAAELWRKVAYNSALNALCALLDVPYGTLPERTETRAIMADVVAELYAVAVARGIAMDPPAPAAYMDLFYEKLVPPTAAHFGSTHEDFRRHRKSEIDALNGAIVRFGEAAGVACPVNQTITRLVKARERGYGDPPFGH
jgi:2-dehydropantoate 2-reductase